LKEEFLLPERAGYLRVAVRAGIAPKQGLVQRAKKGDRGLASALYPFC
jgi:hypothetical protein